MPIVNCGCLFRLYYSVSIILYAERRIYKTDIYFSVYVPVKTVKIMDILLLTRQILLDSFYEVSARVVKNRATWKTIVFLGLLMQTVRLSAQTISDLQSRMIWTQPADHPNGQQQYAVFRKTFYLDDIATKDPEVEIFADSRYLLWINGK